MRAAWLSEQSRRPRDLGVKHLAVLVDNSGDVTYVPNPQHLERAQAALRRANRTLARRQGPVVIDPGTGAKSFRTPSANWREAKAALGRAHARVRHLREDALHKLTTGIAATYGTVVVEDLNVAGMLKNGRLARRIADAGFGTIRRHLASQTSRSAGSSRAGGATPRKGKETGHRTRSGQPAAQGS